MFTIVNQFSFLIFAGLTGLFMLVLLFWNEQSRRKQIVTVVLFAAVAGSYLLVRPGASNVEAGQVDALMAAAAGDASAIDQPVLIEAYSNY